MAREGFLADAWALAHEPGKSMDLYRRAAKSDAEVALALARYTRATDRDGERSRRALVDDGSAPLVAPLVIAQLFGSSWPGGAALRELGELRGARAVRAAIDATKDDRARLAMWSALATWGSADDRAAAAEHLDDEPDELAFALAASGHDDAQQRIARSLDAWLDRRAGAWRMTSSAFEGVMDVVARIGELRIAAAVPALVRAVDSPLASVALVALARIGDPRGVAAARDVDDQIRGPDDNRTWMYTLPARWLLATHGERVEIAPARAALANIAPSYYGYPNLGEVELIRGSAGELLVRAGTNADAEALLAWATDSEPWFRAIGLAAHDRLGHPRPALVYWDDGKIDHALVAKTGVATLVDAVASPTSVHKSTLATRLAATKKPAARDAAVTWAVRTIESMRNFHVDDLDGASERAVGVEASIAIEIIGANRTAKVAKTSTAPWVRALVSGEAMTEAPGVTADGSVIAGVRRLDHAPFVFGHKINAIALDPSGTRLAVTGDEVLAIIDARSGETACKLVQRYRWGFDCAWSPDGALVAVAYHGGHLVVYDAATGAERTSLPGFGGVPHGVKRCAFSPDGKWLAAAGGDGQAHVFAWPAGKSRWTAKGPGSFEAVAWSADGKLCTFSHVSAKRGQPNYLLVVDVAAKKATKLAMPSSIWCIADAGERRFAGGSAQALELGPKGKPSGKLAQSKVVRLVAHGDTLVGAGETGEISTWQLGGKKPKRTVIAKELGAVWALDVAANGTIYAAGDSGLVHRFSLDGTSLDADRGITHTKQVRGFARFADGSVITCGWDGRVLRWPADFGSAELVARYDSRVAEIAVHRDHERAFVGIPAGVLAVPMAGPAKAIKLAKDEDVEALACDDDRLAVATKKNRVIVFRLRDLTRDFTVELTDPSALMFRPDGTLVAGTEAGWLVAYDRSGAEIWRRSEHEDLVDKLPHGNPHRVVVGLAASGDAWASLSNDDSLRLFAGERRRRRFLVDAGLFNGVAFSPDGARVALVGGFAVTLYDVARGEHIVTIPKAAFDGADELTRPGFVDDHRILVGAENGAIYEVAID